MRRGAAAAAAACVAAVLCADATVAQTPPWLNGTVIPPLQPVLPAVSDYVGFLDLSGADTTYFHRLARHAASLGDIGAAVVAARRVTELTPNDAVGWSNLANVLLRAGELGDAGDAARHAVQLASSSSTFGARPHSIVLQVRTNVCLCCVDALCLLSMPACSLLHSLPRQLFVANLGQRVVWVRMAWPLVSASCPVPDFQTCELLACCVLCMLRLKIKMDHISR
jgi:hypothetical protein